MKFKVLIADDEQRICNLISKLIDWDALDLEIIGVVHNGFEALQVIQKQNPDIIITDIRMPEFDGINLIRLVKDINPETSAIIISGYREFSYARSALQYGADDYLLKPIKEMQLTNTLKRIISKKRESIQVLDELMLREQQVLNSSDRLHAAFVQDLLQRDKLIGIYKIEDINRDYNCRFVSNAFTVAAIKIDFKEEFDSQSFERYMNTYVRSIVDHQLEERGFVYCSLVIGGLFYLVMNCDIDSREKLNTSLHHILLSLKDLSRSSQIARVTIGLGLTGNTVAEVKRSAEQARIMVMDRIIYSGDKILEYKVDKPAWSVSHYFDLRDRKRLQDALSTLQQERLEELIRDVGKHIRDDSNLIGGEAVYLIFHEMIHLLISGCHDFFPDIKWDELLRANISCLESCDSISAFERDATNLIKSVYSVLEESKQLEERRPILNAKRYMHDHYNENLTLEQISALAGFNSTYFSSIFKKETGQNFLEYLTVLRIHKAKELLADTSMKVSEIAWEVGYSDEKYFLRIFKKTVGLTTGEYRKLYYSEHKR